MTHALFATLYSTIERGDICKMYTWKLRSREERPATQDVDDLIFDSNDEWSASER